VREGEKDRALRLKQEERLIKDFERLKRHIEKGYLMKAYFMVEYPPIVEHVPSRKDCFIDPHGMVLRI